MTTECKKNMFKIFCYQQKKRKIKSKIDELRKDTETGTQPKKKKIILVAINIMHLKYSHTAEHAQTITMRNFKNQYYVRLHEIRNLTL